MVGTCNQVEVAGFRCEVEKSRIQALVCRTVYSYSYYVDLVTMVNHTRLTVLD
jgi:hypothetical protein